LVSCAPLPTSSWLNVCVRNEKQHKWNPFDPDSIPQDVPKNYPNARFIVNVRHKKPYDDPELVLSDFSKPIITFMRYASHASFPSRVLTFLRRAAVGNQFFKDKPHCPVTQLFIAMKDIRQKQARSRELVEDEESTEYAKEVEKLGYIEATRGPSAFHFMLSLG
jgi:hypothetical protein